MDEFLRHIFAVPVPNSIGTNDLNNAITLVELAKNRPKLREVRRDFKKYAAGGKMVFLPVFSADTIAYTQTRGFTLFNVATGASKSHVIAPIPQITIADVTVSDWSKRRFLFHLSVDGAEGLFSRLELIELSGSSAEHLSYHDIQEHLPPMDQIDPAPVQLGRTTFYFNRGEKPPLLHALDEQLRPTEHPLLRVFNGPPALAKAGLPRLHPQLPLAVFHDGSTLWAATWTGNGPAQTFPLLSAAPDEIQFSPDGKWLAYLDSAGERRVLVAMPVDPALPHRLGPPVVLRGAEALGDRWNGACAWITEPTGVACSIRKNVPVSTGEWKERYELLKWDLSPGNIEKASP